MIRLKPNGNQDGRPSQTARLFFWEQKNCNLLPLPLGESLGESMNARFDYTLRKIKQFTVPEPQDSDSFFF